MKFWVGVENFAKIENAKICVNKYSVLVGQNNTGKSFLMQLVQGINSKIWNLIDEEFCQIVFLDEKKRNQCKWYKLDSNNLSEVISYLNKKLKKEKENIIKAIFKKEIEIGELYIDIELENEEEYELISFDNKEFKEDFYLREALSFEDIGIPETFLDMVSKFPDNISVRALNRMNAGGTKRETLFLTITPKESEDKSCRELLNSILKYESLFLPASRTGLLLLYREFFANKADGALSFKIQNDKIVNSDEYVGFTEPIYDFLRFLQTYTEHEESMKMYKNELRFFENNVIEGRIKVNKQGMISYDSKNGKKDVPMYLASSMINEVAPIILAITSNKHYQRLIIDEVEASLHPEKQLELVRFLNRLNNSGIKLIISTHSDTFVSKLNNLFVLSNLVKSMSGKEILEKFDLKEKDLLNVDNLYVYEFLNQTNGKSIVKEINPDNKMGYQFDLFTNSALKLYDEAIKLGEIL